MAARQTGSDRRTVAIIGDGAMTAGMAYEALNHGGDLDTNLLVSYLLTHRPPIATLIDVLLA